MKYKHCQQEFEEDELNENGYCLWCEEYDKGESKEESEW